MTPETRPAVFLDRDGTLIAECGYLSRLDAITFFPYSIDAVRLLNRSGLVVVVLTNQSGVARGYFDEAFVQETHRVLGQRIAAGGGRVDAFYYCPHYPGATIERYRRACDCRKPRPDLATSLVAANLMEATSWILREHVRCA